MPLQYYVNLWEIVYITFQIVFTHKININYTAKASLLLHLHLLRASARPRRVRRFLVPGRCVHASHYISLNVWM